MKLFYLLSALALLTLLCVPAHAQIILAPGEEKTFTTSSALNGQNGDNNNNTFTFFSDYDLSSKTVRAGADASAISVGRGTAFAQINYEFQISETSDTKNNSLGAWISYDVEWLGRQLVLEVFGSNANVNVELLLRDVTANKLIKRETIHNLDVKTHRIKYVDVGFDFNDEGSMYNTFPAVLKRGHQYRLTLKLTVDLFRVAVTVTGITSSNYYDLGGGVELNSLYVKLGLDEKETLQKLTAIDSLESRIDTLEYKLDHHYHVYLTGRGTGHNNTEANTTLSIFEAGSVTTTDPPHYYTEPNIVPDENMEEKSIPEEFSLSQNFPNPFNPSTKISFSIPAQELVTIKIYDILGRQVDILMDEVREPGYYEVNFNAETLPSGTYIYEIRAGNFIESKKMLLLK